ncbi:MAG: hypothetical protein ACE5G1_14195 [bacterium]
MKKLKNETWLLVAIVAIFILGAILMGMSGDSLASFGQCCF